MSSTTRGAGTVGTTRDSTGSGFGRCRTMKIARMTGNNGGEMEALTIDTELESTHPASRPARHGKPFKRLNDLIAAFNAANAQVQFAEQNRGNVAPEHRAQFEKEVIALQIELDRATADLYAYKSRGKGKHPAFQRSVLSRRLEDRSIYTPHQGKRECARRAARAQRETL